MTFKVLVDDNFHYMDESHRGSLGDLETAEAAVTAAKAIVDQYLNSAHTPGMTADALLPSYRMFGEDPFIVGADVDFSAWEYARARCREICANS